jgi:L-threonylcarbamoyladenylate synthase
MRELIEKDAVPEQELKILKSIKDGEVFIYPTDTIYGIGCDATNSEAVNKIREIKERPDMPFSVIAPSREWVIENCELNDAARQWLESTPRSSTVILKLKNDNAVCRETNLNIGTIGIRIPKHWFTEILQKSGAPIITTSVNRTGRNVMTSMEDLSHKIQSKVDFIVYEGEKQGRPSKIIDFSKEEVKVIER